jgi:hypothetical protein
MNSMSAGFYAAVSRLGQTGQERTWTSLGMLDGSDGPARIVFKSEDRSQRCAVVPRWLAIVRVDHRIRHATSVIWLLDGSTVEWAGGTPPAQLRHGTTGLDSETNPVLWFHARGPAARRRPAKSGARLRPRRGVTATLAAGRRVRFALPRLPEPRLPWRFTVYGVLGAAGIVDGARVEVSRPPLHRNAALRMTVATRMWGLSGDLPDIPADGPAGDPSLTIKVAGALQPLDLGAVQQWF